MSDTKLQQAIEAVRDVEVDPASQARVAERIQHGALLRRRPWKVLSLAAAVVLAFVLWPRPTGPASEPSALAPPPEEEIPAEVPEKVEETPIEEPAEEELVEEAGDAPFEGTFGLLDDSARDGSAAARKWNKELAAPLAKLRKLAGGRVVVRMGEFDSVHDVLKHYKLPHTITVDLDAETLAKAGVVFLPCTRQPTKDVDFEPLTKFVKAGGWLVASDWSIHWLQRAAPGTIVARKPARTQPNIVIEVESAATSPLLAGVFGQKGTRWWFEEASRFARPEAKPARTLVRSPKWKKRYESDDLVIACPYGKGLVVFTQAHFCQDRRASSIDAMHRFVLNILIERFRKK